MFGRCYMLFVTVSPIPESLTISIINGYHITDIDWRPTTKQQGKGCADDTWKVHNYKIIMFLYYYIVKLDDASARDFVGVEFVSRVYPLFLPLGEEFPKILY